MIHVKAVSSFMLLRPQVGVLILNYNGIKHLNQCFDSLLQQTFTDFEIVMVDNNSNDDSICYVKNTYPFVKIISLSQNFGFAKAYNLAISQCDYKYIVFLNNDTVVEKKWLSELVDAADAGVGDILGSKMLMHSNRNLINHNGGKFSIIGNSFDIDFLEVDNCKSKELPKLVGCVSGGSMLIKRDTFIDLGCFDTDCFFGFEDANICWRAWLKGLSVAHVPTSVVYHKIGVTWKTRQNEIWLLYHSEVGRLSNMLKNLGLKRLLLAIPVSLVYAVIRAVLLFPNTGFASMRVTISAHFKIVKNLKRILKQRRDIQNNRCVSDIWLLNNGLMVGINGGSKEFFRLIKMRGIKVSGN